MSKNSKQRRAEKAREAAAANGTSYQQELERQRHQADGTPPGGGSPPAQDLADINPGPRWRVPTVAEGVLLEELGLPVPEGLPRLGAAYIAAVVDDFGTGRDQIGAYDEDSDLTLFEDFAITVVRVGGWMPGRKARALVASGSAVLTPGDDGVDDGDGVPVEFPNHYTIHSSQQVAVMGEHEEPQGWEHSWKHELVEQEPHQWKASGPR